MTPRSAADDVALRALRAPAAPTDVDSANALAAGTANAAANNEAAAATTTVTAAATAAATLAATSGTPHHRPLSKNDTFFNKS